LLPFVIGLLRLLDLAQTIDCPLILKTAFQSVVEDDLATVMRVLRIGTGRPNSLLNQGKKS
jgi:hypothetical protein